MANQKSSRNEFPEKINISAVNYIEMPRQRELRQDDFITPPPSPPQFPPPPPPPVENITAMGGAPEDNDFPPPPPAVTGRRESSLGSSSSESPEVSRSPTPQLRLYADGDIRSLQRNPIYSDILKAAEKFKDRREYSSSLNDELNSIQKGEPTSDYERIVNYLKPSQSVQHPVYDPAAIRRKKNSFIVNSKETWNRPTIVQRKNTYRVAPSSPSAELKTKVDKKPNIPKYTKSDINEIKSIEDVPSIDEILQTLPNIDERGNLIPEWKRKLMAQNQRMKMCQKVQT